jgi:hypothetical protein
MFPMQEDRNQEDCKVLGNFVSYIKIIMDFLSSKVGPNTLPMSRVCHNCSNFKRIPPHFSTQNWGYIP